MKNIKTYKKDSYPLFKFAKVKITNNPEIVFNPKYIVGKGKVLKRPNPDYMRKKAVEKKT